MNVVVVGSNNNKSGEIDRSHSKVVLVGKRDQILRALFNEKVATSVSHQNFVTF